MWFVKENVNYVLSHSIERYSSGGKAENICSDFSVCRLNSFTSAMSSCTCFSFLFVLVICLGVVETLFMLLLFVFIFFPFL